jgi:hypothetical protein
LEVNDWGNVELRSSVMNLRTENRGASRHDGRKSGYDDAWGLASDLVAARHPGERLLGTRMAHKIEDFGIALPHEEPRA